MTHLLPRSSLRGAAGAFLPGATFVGAGLAGAATFFSSTGADAAGVDTVVDPEDYDAKKAAAPAPS